MYINIRKRTPSKNNCHNCHNCHEQLSISSKKQYINKIRISKSAFHNNKTL